MNSLPDDVLQKLAVRFCITCADNVKQGIVDQLGLNCRNHFIFGYYLMAFCGDGVWLSYAKGDYLALTKTIT